MDEDELQECRRAALRKWLAENGGHGKIVRRFGLSKTQASMLSQVVNGYSFANRAARNMEKLLRMPSGFLDPWPTTLPLAGAPDRPAQDSNTIDVEARVVPPAPPAQIAQPVTITRDTAGIMGQWSILSLMFGQMSPESQAWLLDQANKLVNGQPAWSEQIQLVVNSLLAFPEPDRSDVCSEVEALLVRRHEALGRKRQRAEEKPSSPTEPSPTTSPHRS